MRVSYVTSKRLTTIARQLSERERQVANEVDRLNASSAGQLRMLHYADTEAGRRAARRDLQHLTELGVLARLGRRVGGERAGSAGFVFSLDIAGQRLLRSTAQRHRRPWTPGPSQLRHVLMVAQLYVELRTAETDSSKLSVFDAEPAAWRSFYGPAGARVMLKPDAFVRVLNGDYEDSFFVEVDLATEASSRIVAKAKTYISYFQSGREQADRGVFPRVLWAVPNSGRADQLALPGHGLR